MARSQPPFGPGAGQLPTGRWSQGTIEVITGSMFSGKTEELIRRVKRAAFARQRIQAFKPRIDDRYDASQIVSHASVLPLPGGLAAAPAARHDEGEGGESIAGSIAAVAVGTSESLEQRVDEQTQVVAIDEAQFFDRGIVDVVQRLADKGVRVIVAGLDQDYLGRPFYPMPELMAVAEEVTKVHAVCTSCGGEASRSQRLIADAGTVLVGGSESYEARCRACYEARDIPR